MGTHGVKLGVAGCGASRTMFGPALKSLGDAEVVAWMDPLLEKAKRAADAYGGTVYTDYSEFLKHDDLDAVIIASPIWLHLPQVRETAAAGKHILCEKPMARNMSECQEIIDVCRNADVILMPGFMKRFDPAFLLVKQMIDSGELGEVFEISSDWSWPQYFLSGWRDTVKCQGGLLQDHGSHTVDLARWWVGDIESVFASVRLLFEGREVEDYAHVVCRHTNGCISIHHNSRMTHRSLRECYRIEGSKGTLTVECEGQWSFNHLYPFTVKLYRNTKGISSICEDISPKPGTPLDEQLKRDNRYSGELQYFLDCIMKNKPPAYCSGQDGLAAIEVVNAAYLSARRNQAITLPLKGQYDLDEVFRFLGTAHRIENKQ